MIVPREKTIREFYGTNELEGVNAYWQYGDKPSGIFEGGNGWRITDRRLSGFAVKWFGGTSFHIYYNLSCNDEEDIFNVSTAPLSLVDAMLIVKERVTSILNNDTSLFRDHPDGDYYYTLNKGVRFLPHGNPLDYEYWVINWTLDRYR